jgi:uncharacterized oxidoreductase
VAEFARYPKDTPLAESSQGVLYPGEIEAMAERERRARGVEIEEATWNKLQGLADQCGVRDRLGYLRGECA